MSNITEVAPDVFRISTFVPEANLQFSQFLVRDDEPLLFHTGQRVLFPIVHEAVAQLIKPSELRWIGFSHFEADECGSLKEWQDAAPQARPFCSFVGKVVSIDDFLGNDTTKAMMNGETLETGKYRFRFLNTPHVPHCWEAALLFEETGKTLFCSDLFHQNGDVEPLTSGDVIGRARKTFIEYDQSPFANYMPYTKNTDATLRSLAHLEPKTLATMHGSVYSGDGKQALLDLASMMRELLG